MRGKAQQDGRQEVSQMETFAKFSGSKILGERDLNLYAEPEIFIPLWRHIKQKSLVQFPQKIPTIEAEVHQNHLSVTGH